MIHYLESSAAVKLVLEEAETAAVMAYLDDHRDDQIVACALLETELRRAANRADAPQSKVTEVLDLVDLVVPPKAIFHEAGLLPGDHLRSLDALHLATAIAVEAEVLVAYDKRLLEAASQLGLEVASPS